MEFCAQEKLKKQLTAFLKTTKKKLKKIEFNTST